MAQHGEGIGVLEFSGLIGEGDAGAVSTLTNGIRRRNAQLYE